MRRLLSLGTVALFVAISGANCLWPFGNIDTREAGLRKFTSAEELRKFLADQASKQYQTPTYDGDFMFFDSLPAPSPADMTANAEEDAGAGSGETTYSTTNLQEIGVDESDIIKNNGQYIYVLENNTIHVIQAMPAANLAELATIPITDTPDSFYLYGDKLIVLSRKYAWYPYYYYYDYGPMGAADMDTTAAGVEEKDDGNDGATEEGGEEGEDEDDAEDGGEGEDSEGSEEPEEPQTPPDVIGDEWSDGSETVVTVIDVTNPVNPSVLSTIRMEGDLVSSRMIDNYLYVVMTTTPFIPWSATTETIENMTLEQWLPDYQVTDGDGKVVGSGDITSWDNFYRPETPDGYGITTVATINVDEPSSTPATTAITANAGVIYASSQSLYVTDTQYDWMSGSGRSDTIVHKLGFTEAATAYVGSGVVPGRPLNQYSLGEYNDYLRIATTLETYTFTGSDTTNGVYVMGVNGTTLDIVGRVENIAPGEDIYSARFLGPRGFLVTFKVVDPLFTLDLSQPTNPRIVGELKVPGYSDHIQLLDENHLLTIGKDALPDPAGGDFSLYQGVQLSIFDITNMASPQLMHKEIIGTRGTNSEANWNPKAFVYYPAKQALAFPLDLYEGVSTGWEYGTYTFSGLYVYRVTLENGFEQLGRISSRPEDQADNDCWVYWGFTRGVFIDNNVYSVMDRGVKVARLDDVNTLIGSIDYANAPAIDDNCNWWYDDMIDLMPVAEGIR